jgi:hypothetical protein
MKRCVLSCFYLAVCLNLSAQVTSLLEDLNPGLALAGGGIVGKEVSGFDLQAGWAFNPRWDIAVHYTHVDFNTSDQYTYDAYTDGISLTGSWWMWRPSLNRSTTFGLALQGGVESNQCANYSYWLENEQGDKWFGHQCVRLGLESTLSHWVSERGWFQPQVIVWGEGGRYYHTKGGFRHPVSYGGNIACQAGLAYAQKLAFNQALFIKPIFLFRFTSDEPVSYYGAPVFFQLSAGYLISF